MLRCVALVTVVLGVGCSGAPSATAGGGTDTAKFSSGHSDAWPNEPAGMRVISERKFDAKNEASWKDEPSADFSIEQDADAPKSPTSVGEAYYPAGFVAGSEPISVNRDLGSTAHSLYISFWVKFSPNWFGQAASNKIVHIFISDVNRVFLYGLGEGSAPMSPRVGLQQVPVANGAFGSRDLRPNLIPDAKLLPGRWHRWELLLTSNTGGNSDGQADWWLDGVHVGSYSDLAIVTASQGHTWQILQWAPTWGGIGGAVPAGQYMRMDHIYISGK
jgi:hypothetical protein